MTATVPDVGSLEHLDFEPACQVVNCDRPAAFHWTSIPCRCTDSLACSPCTVAEMKVMAKATVTRWNCTMCFLDYGRGSALDFFRIDPL